MYPPNPRYVFLKILRRGFVLLPLCAVTPAPGDEAGTAHAILCWGDSLSTATLWPHKLQAEFPHRQVRSQAVGGEGVEGILGRMFGQVLLPPEILGDGDERLVRLRTTRHVIPRLNNENYRRMWPQALLALYDPIDRIEFRMGSQKLGVAKTPVTIPARTDFSRSTTRIFAPGHDLAEHSIVWFETDGRLPGALETARTFRDVRYPSRHYYVRNPEPNSFELAEFSHWHPEHRSHAPVLNLESEADGPFRVITGYAMDWRPGDAQFDPADIRIHPVFERNRATHILWMGANNLNEYSAQKHGGPQAPRVQAAIRQAFEYLGEFSDRILVLTVLNGSYPDRGPGSVSHEDFLAVNRWILETYPDHSLDIVAILHAKRGPGEPELPELRPMLDTDGNPLAERDGAPLKAWVGPGFTPTHFAADRIHLNDAAYAVMAKAITAELRRRGW